MFKSNLSPLNPSKHPTPATYPPPDPQNTSTHHQSTYQYKGMYTTNTTGHYKQQETGGYGNNGPLSPLSPNVCKNPMSPTAKIKMYSNNVLGVNGNSNANSNNNHNHNSRKPQQPRQPTTKHLPPTPKYTPTLTMCDSIDLKCDQVLQTPSILTSHQPQFTPSSNLNPYRKQTPSQPLTIKRTTSKIAALNLESEMMDDLMCDEVLDIGKEGRDQGGDNRRRRNCGGGGGRYNVRNRGDGENVMGNNNSSGSSGGNGSSERQYQQQQYQYQAQQQQQYQQYQYQQQYQHCPLTPVYDKPKKQPQHPLITMRKTNTISDRTLDPHPSINNPTSTPSLHTIPSLTPSYTPTVHQKPCSFTHILSPPSLSQHNNQQQQQHAFLSPTLSNQHLMHQLQRMKQIMNAYKEKVELKDRLLEETREKVVFLQRENQQFRKIFQQQVGNGGQIGSGGGSGLSQRYNQGGK